MSLEIPLAHTVIDHSAERHLEADEIAAYLHGVQSRDARARIESHLAACDACRAEVVEVSRIVATLPPSRFSMRRAWLPAIAAAAVLVLITWQGVGRDRMSVAHRQAPVSTPTAPRALNPVGVVDSVNALTWSSIPRADSYRIQVFDQDATLLWSTDASDTTIALPPTVRLGRDRRYFWKVDASLGFDRRVASELTEFSLRPRAP